MDLDQVLILAPEGPLRAGLEAVLLRLGRPVAARDCPWAHEPPPEGDLIVLDLREGDEGHRRMAAALRSDPRPLAIVADRPCGLIHALQDRPAGMMLITGDASEGGWRVALHMCAALRGGALVGVAAGPALAAG